jgi:hypothetical protein
MNAALHHWWLAWGPSPATAIAAGAAMVAVCALTWLCGTRAEGFLERGGRRPAVAGAVVGITAGVTVITADVCFGTRNHAGVYVTVGCLAGFIAGMEAWSLSAHRRSTGTWSRRADRVYRAQRKQREY